jgi:hypothetical protein
LFGALQETMSNIKINNVFFILLVLITANVLQICAEMALLVEPLSHRTKLSK